MTTDTGIKDFSIRFTNQQDTGLILQFIKELADYEHMLDQVAATEELLADSLFVQKRAEAIIGEYQQEPVCFALFFHNFSTFIGKSGLYIEDLYVTPKMRGKGLGAAMLTFLAGLAKERNCGRMEWWCLDWNTPSIRFYQQLGAQPMDEWTVYRLQDTDIERLAGHKKL